MRKCTGLDDTLLGFPTVVDDTIDGIDDIATLSLACLPCQE